jgi:hypothetical protein
LFLPELELVWTQVVWTLLVSCRLLQKQIEFALHETWRWNETQELKRTFQLKIRVIQIYQENKARQFLEMNMKIVQIK